MTNVKVKGSYLPTGCCTTSSSALNMVKHGTMTATTSSGMNGMDTLSTSLIVENAGEGGGHSRMRKDNGRVPVKVGDLTDPMAGVISLDRQSIKILVGTSIRIR